MSSSLRIYTLSATHHCCTILPLLQITLRIFQSRCYSIGHCLYTFYDAPGLELTLTLLSFLTTSWTSFMSAPLRPNASSGFGGLITTSHCRRSWSLVLARGLLRFYPRSCLINPNVLFLKAVHFLALSLRRLLCCSALCSISHLRWPGCRLSKLLCL